MFVLTCTLVVDSSCGGSTVLRSRAEVASVGSKEMERRENGRARQSTQRNDPSTAHHVVGFLSCTMSSKILQLCLLPLQNGQIIKNDTLVPQFTSAGTQQESK